MNLGTKVQTWEEAEQVEPITISGYKDWYRLARLVNGYELATQKGFDLKKWGRQKHINWQDTHRWDLSLIELLMMLFYFWRKQHMTGGASWGEEIDSILHEIAQLKGQKYGTDSRAIREEAEYRQSELLNSFRFIHAEEKDEI